MDDSRDTPAGPFDIPPDDGVAGADGSTDEEQDDEKDANASPDG